MRIIPSIDIIDGKCVRLTQGDFKKAKIYRESPLEVAKEFEDADIEYLHLVDLDGARKGKVVNWNVIEKIQAHTALKVDFGGGVKTEYEVEHLLDLGLEQINIGSMAAREPGVFSGWLQKYGPENFILSADVRDECVLAHGWTEMTNVSIYDLATQFEKEGLKYLACTDIASEGMMQGPNFGLYKKLKRKFPLLKLIAAGGISSSEDLTELNYIQVYAAVVGKAIYEHKIKLQELRSF